MLRPMSAEPSRFHESNLWSTPIRDLGLTIEGTRLEPLLAEFREELRRIGLTRVRPSFYLSTEWGVPFETVAIAIPFYLARPDLTALHVERTGHLEGFDRSDILRYLRHEMGHVVNYGYRLYDDEEWVKQFGSITQPYGEEYRPEPFSRRYVRHLPGWYAQKHPDEDWAETFAVWMTPGPDWRAEYGGWPVAAAKLAYCERTIQRLIERDPVVTDASLDEDVGEIEYSSTTTTATTPPSSAISRRGSTVPCAPSSRTWGAATAGRRKERSLRPRRSSAASSPSCWRTCSGGRGTSPSGPGRCCASWRIARHTCSRDTRLRARPRPSSPSRRSSPA